mgnify:CR=1 FL=1
MHLYIHLFCCLGIKWHKTINQRNWHDRTFCPGCRFETSAFEFLYLITLFRSCTFRKDKKVLSRFYIKDPPNSFSRY